MEFKEKYKYSNSDIVHYVYCVGNMEYIYYTLSTEMTIKESAKENEYKQIRRRHLWCHLSIGQRRRRPHRTKSDTSIYSMKNVYT